MINIIRLVQNENIKIYKRLSTWVMVSILIISVLIGGLVTKYILIENGSDEWQEELLVKNAEIESQIQQLEEMRMGNATRPLEEELLINEYRIENNIPPVETETLWGFMTSIPDLTAIASVFTIVIGAGIVAGEFSTGTIKLLLIRPVNRYKILLSKFLATILFALFLLALLFTTSFIVGSVLFGFGGIDLPYLKISNGQVIEGNMIQQILQLYGFNSIDLLMMVTFGFMISTVFRSSSMAIGLSLFLMFTGQQIVQLFNQYDWVKYILFTHTNLAQHTSGIPIVEGMTLSFSITVLLVYFTIFIATSFMIFQKRDVAT